MPYKNRDEKNAKWNIWYAERRASWFADKQCVRCGSTDRLELDHVDPSTKVTSSIWTWAEARRNTELAKCQVLCHLCHLQKTFEGEEAARGEQNGQARLTDRMVKEARDLHSTGGFSYRELGRRFGVSHVSMRSAIIGRTWKHI